MASSRTVPKAVLRWIRAKVQACGVNARLSTVPQSAGERLYLELWWAQYCDLDGAIYKED